MKRNCSSIASPVCSRIDVIGRSCRLPGANNVEAFWELLVSGRCSVTEMDPERFSMFRYKNPRSGERGKAYTFASGVLDDVWGFDPSAFGILPRETLQMDPQQRLLLMLVWEALEDAGLPPSNLGDRTVGVYVGNSGTEHEKRFLFDPAGSDSYMMTGNTGALISNRVSYIYDLHGPSKTIDTACSSSLVALDEAVSALRSGQIDTAIVAGVNLMLSPFPFVGFSAATMLSPKGLCKAFDEDAYGYVRAEGGVVLVLQRSDDDKFKSIQSYARIVETGVNSDGRTTGVALPSAQYQGKLLKQVYDRAGVNPQDLAFIEAHGTGTRVGDPVEAEALGTELGIKRSMPLPIGSVKSNIGHLEPASGIVGLLKAMLALEHNYLPASLHFENPNPDIPFDDLNIEVNAQARDLEIGKGERYAGVNNFGFGGTNVHVILTDPARDKITRHSNARIPSQKTLMLSAHCRGALKELAQHYEQRIESQTDLEIDELINASAYQRERLEERLVIFGEDGDSVKSGLNGFIRDGTAANIATGRALSRELETTLVYAGNGCQWAGMGRDAFEKNQKFKASLKRIDVLFSKIAGWSLVEMLFAEDLNERLQSTIVAQPLLFAIQVALTQSLMKMGLKINGVIGHSVGEVAAAWASGALTLKQSVQIIYVRSQHQETVRGEGKMAAIMSSEKDVRVALDQNEAFTDIDISAFNGPNSITISGPGEAVENFVHLGKRKGWTCKTLPVDYPFHSALIEPIRDDLVKALKKLKPGQQKCPFYSTVSGKLLAGPKLNSEYWWKNIRQPVQFAKAITAAANDGCRLFLEISPKPVLRSYLRESLDELSDSFTIIHSLMDTSKTTDGPENKEGDPVRTVFARAIASGASFDEEVVFGTDRKLECSLPLYPWQNTPYKLDPSVEAVEAFLLTVPPHPLLGQQLRPDEYVWTADLDTQILPYLQDHQVDGKVILPGAGFAEMALAAASQWLDERQVELRDMDILQALVLADDHAMQVQTRISVESGTIEIASRRRLSDDDWQTHVKCRVAKLPGDQIPALVAPKLCATDQPEQIERLYELSKLHGLDFGPRFRRMIRCDEPQDDVLEVVLNERDKSLNTADGESSDYVLHPLDLDGCFHSLNILYDKLHLGNDRLSFIPVRLGILRVYLPSTPVRTARVTILRSNRRGGQCNFELFDEGGRLIATLHDARFRAAALVQRHTLARTSYSFTHKLLSLPVEAQRSATPAFDKILQKIKQADTRVDPSLDEQRLLLDAAARRTAYDILYSLADDNLRLDADLIANASASDSLEDTTHILALISNLLEIAEQSGFATLEAASADEPQEEEETSRPGNIWNISPDCLFPPRADLIKALLEEAPGWLAECTLLNRAFHLLSELFVNGTVGENRRMQDYYSPSMLEQMNSSSPLAHAHIEKLAQTIEKIIADWPIGKPLRILELGVGGGGLTKRLLPMVAERHGQLVSADINSFRIKRLKMQFAGSPFFRSVIISSEDEIFESEGPFDLLVSANELHHIFPVEEVINDAAAKLAHDGLVLFTTSRPDAFHDIVFGPVEGWFDLSIDPSFPLNPMKQPKQWLSFFERNGFAVGKTFPVADELDGAVIVAASRKENKSVFVSSTKSETTQEPDGPKRHILIAATKNAREAKFTARLLDNLADHGIADSESLSPLKLLAQNDNGTDSIWSQLIEKIDQSEPNEIVELVHLIGAFENECAALHELSRRMNNLTDLLQTLGGRKARLWIIAPGGVRAMNGSGSPSPMQSGIWAMGRTAQNEYGDLDIRLVDFNQDLKPKEQSKRLAALMAQPGTQSEMILTRDAMLSLRAVRGLPETSKSNFDVVDDKAEIAFDNDRLTRLTSPVSGSLDQLSWESSGRRAPGDDEIELEVAATGLNFRDVMWAQGLLPDEAMEDGFAGPTLGFECSGIITRIGANIKKAKGFAVGDRVMALAPNCFASHVTVAAHSVVGLPENINLDAAATVPVTFLTAYYSLHHLGSIEEDEWVLIHGAAGGVGLAALQVAKWCGAKIIATAGSDEKRQLLQMLGADHVLNTRTLNFVDEVRALTRDNGGVDVVLNSLAGEAMERSLELLRPFGRFLELGKRDYYGNSKIGLRPFRNNISYFGIDADQLLNHQPKLCRRLFSELSALFESGQFGALPYRMFTSDNVIDAFRLMQQSGHIGKILVKAPSAAQQTSNLDLEFSADTNGTHIIVGGVGGFGLEAARWLADSGATSIVLTSRSGKISEQGEETLKILKAKNVAVEIAKCDVTDEEALGKLLNDLRVKRPIKGVLHTAMVLEDELIQNLQKIQIDNVLAPKVSGGDALDRLTRTDDLDYFVMFSSVAAMFGNPGQANYVAANAYMEGIARRRRLLGLPAIAVGWGAITDVGVLTRHKDTAESLARHTGGVEFRARQGLDLLSQLLAMDDKEDAGNTSAPVITLAAMNWAFAGDVLPILKKSSFTMLAREGSHSSVRGTEVVDVRALIDGLDQTEARDLIARLLIEEVSSIFRMPVEEINAKRSLSDMGMDSLMGAELRTAAQQKLDMDIPMVSIADGTTVNDIAAKVLSRVYSNEPVADTVLADTGEMLAQQHLGDSLDEPDVSELAEKIRQKQEALQKSA